MPHSVFGCACDVLLRIYPFRRCKIWLFYFIVACSWSKWILHIVSSPCVYTNFIEYRSNCLHLKYFRRKLLPKLFLSLPFLSSSNNIPLQAAYIPQPQPKQNKITKPTDTTYTHQLYYTRLSTQIRRRKKEKAISKPQWKSSTPHPPHPPSSLSRSTNPKPRNPSTPALLSSTT